MDIAEEIKFELEAIAESKCGPIWEGIKNADILGRALNEIQKLRINAEDYAIIQAMAASNFNTLDAVIRALELAEGYQMLVEHDERSYRVIFEKLKINQTEVN